MNRRQAFAVRYGRGYLERDRPKYRRLQKSMAKLAFGRKISDAALFSHAHLDQNGGVFDESGRVLFPKLLLYCAERLRILD